MAEARLHHHIPEFYLRGFTVGSGKKRKIQVAVTGEGRFFETNPKKVAKIRDFMRVEIDGMKPDGLENELSGFEGKAAGAIRRVANSGKFEGEDRELILNLIALLASRSPQRREYMRGVMEDMSKK